MVKQVPGVGYMTAHLRQLKFHLTSNHTQSVSLVRRSLNNHESYPAMFGEKQEVSDQLPQWKIPSKSCSICYKIFL